MYGISHRAVRDKTKKFNMNIPRKNARKKVDLGNCIFCNKTFKYTKEYKSDGYCSYNCKRSDNLIKEFNLNEEDFDSRLAKDIIRLRKSGLTYSEISKSLNCSNSTIAYYCNETSKERIKQYQENNKEFYRFLKQLDNFKRRKMNTNKISVCANWNKKFRTACSHFRTRDKMELENNFTYHDAIDHLGGEITKCYLTGRKIDITKDDFTLDHIIPVSLGGSCELDNMGITIPEANSMKSNIMLDDFFNLCKEILEFNGYEVNKINPL